LGGFIKSSIGYIFGWHLQANHSHRPWIRKMEKRIAYFLPRFEKKPFGSIFISRFFILGIGWFTVIFSGYKKIPLKIYAKAEALSLVFWSFFMLFLGWIFSFAALSMSHDVRKFLLIILAFFVMFFVLEKIIAFIIELFNLQDLDTNEK
jgi:membrane protein DedA with SNARE-associated domain